MSIETGIEAEVPEEGSSGGSDWSRRKVLKTGALVGGAMVWTVPIVETLGTRIAAASTSTAPGLGSGCYITVSVNSLRPSGSNLTTIVLTYHLNSDPGNVLTETVTVDSSGGITYSPASQPGNLAFTLTSSNTILGSVVPSTETVTVVTVTVNGVLQGTKNGAYSNCNPFEIQAIGA